MAYERREFPEWSWSHSRGQTFKECTRRYFYHYYGSHNGWEDDAPDPVKQAYRLKQLGSVPLEVGGAIHDAAAFALQSARSGTGVPSFDVLRDKVRAKLNQAFMESQDRAGWERQPRRRKMLHEFYYETGLSDRAIEDARERFTACLRNLPESRSFREAVVAPYIEIKGVEGFVTFDLEDTPIHGVPDLVYRLGDDTWVVADWKTGRPGGAWDQTGVYALYLQSRHGVPASQIVARIEWLATGDSDERTLSDDDLQASRTRTLDSVASMKRYLDDPDLNKPREREEFPLRADTSLCRFCRFYELCEEEIASGAGGPF